MTLPTRPFRIGIMGRTFNPIHHEHLVAASEVQGVFALDEVIFAPTWAQPLKKEHKVPPVEHRYLMMVIATASNPRLTVSRVDIDRGGMTYTIDTLHNIAAERPDVELYSTAGAGALAQALTWKNSEGIFGLAHLVGVTRSGYVLSDPEIPRDRISLVEVSAMTISSINCHQRIGEGSPVWCLVPGGIMQYIRKYGLYYMALRPASTTSMTTKVTHEQSLRKENDDEH